MKVCSTCRVEKKLDEFSKNSSSKDGIRYVCRECDRARQRARRAAGKASIKINRRGKKVCRLCLRKLPRSNFNTEWARIDSLDSRCRECANIWSSYRMTYHDRQKLLISQENKCYICGKIESERKLHIDHLHKQGTKRKCDKKDVRGLLCDACNTGIGLLKEDPAVFARALEYLIDPPAQKVLGD